MEKPEPIPEISASELADWMKEQEGLVILDVREPFEIGYARIRDPRVVYAPLSVLASSMQPALPAPALNPQAPIVVICHHGERSAQVALWLKMMGWQRAYNLTGGIDAYAHEIDNSVGTY